MPLFQLRRDRESRSADAAAGKPRPLRDGFDRAARMKILYAIGDSTPSSLSWAEYPFSVKESLRRLGRDSYYRRTR